MSYFTAAGEPPGEWAGKDAAALGLSGQVDPKAIERLYRRTSALVGNSSSSAISPRRRTSGKRQR